MWVLVQDVFVEEHIWERVMTLTTWKYLMDAKLPYKCMQYPRASHRSLIEANVKKKKTMATLGMQCDIYGMCEAKAFIYVRTCVKSSVCVCTYACVWLQGTIYVLCIYAFPMNITLWQKNSYNIYDMCLLLKKENRQDDNVENRREKMEWTIPNAVVLVNNSSSY